MQALYRVIQKPEWIFGFVGAIRSLGRAVGAPRDPRSQGGVFALNCAFDRVYSYASILLALLNAEEALSIR